MPRPTITAEPWTREADPADRDGLALAQVFGVLRRAWLWIALPTLLAAIGAGVFVQVAPERFTGEAKVLLESRDPAFARNASERYEPAQAIDEQAVASQVQVAMSKDIARQAIRALNLVGNPEFDPTSGEIGPVRRTLMLLGLVKNPLNGPPEDRALDAYFERLLVYPVGKSRILAFEFRSKDAELAAKAANTVAELYIASLAAAQTDTARYASTWLGSNIDTLRARVAEAEAKVEAFRAKNGLLASAGSASQPLSTQQLGELSTQLSQARTVKADLAGRVKLLKDMIKEGRAFEIPDVANNELIRRTVESRMSLRAQLALESRTLLPAHPRIKELTAQVNDLETQIKAASERIVRTLENDSRIAGARVDSLQAAVDGQSDVVVKGNGSEVQLRALEREAKVQREQLESYLSRYREAAARDGESASPADARIVSRAVVPEMPSFPKKIPILAVATALAFLLSAGAVIGRHLLASPPAPRPRADPARREEDEDRSAPPAVDPERLAYPEPLPPEPRRFAPAPAAFGNTMTARATPASVAETPHDPVAEVRFSDGAPAKKSFGGDERRRTQAAPQRTRERIQAEPEASAEPQPAADESEDAYEFDLLVERLQAGPSHGGRCILVVETVRHEAGAAPRSIAGSLARHLAARAATLSVDVNGRTGDRDALGLSDLVAGEAAFPDVIQAVQGSRLHEIGSGSTDIGVLVEEPQGLAIGLNALAQAYEWVVCRLDATEGGLHPALLATVAASMDSVVIASDAPADDSGLLALYREAEEAGAGQILVAHDRRAEPRPEADREPEMRLRLSA